MSATSTELGAIAVERGARPGASVPEVTPRGLALSAVLHAGIVALILFGLPSLFRRPPPQETPIAVDLVMIAPETRATQPNPFKPKPEAKPEPPVAAPAPKPEPKPEAPPPAPEPPPSAAAPPPPAPAPAPAPPKPEVTTPPPPPKPVEAHAPTPPPPPPEPKPKPQQAHVAPRPKADPAAFDKMIKTLEQKPPEKRPEPADFDALLKNLTKEQTVQNDEPPRPRPKVMAAAPPSSQPKAPLGSQLTASENDALINLIKQQLVPCWNVPAGARDAKDLNVQIRASVNPDGTVRQAAIIDQGRMSDPLIRAAAESARRTFFNPQCTPLKLPSDKYEIWKDLVVNFDPRDLL